MEHIKDCFVVRRKKNGKFGKITRLYIDSHTNSFKDSLI